MSKLKILGSNSLEKVVMNYCMNDCVSVTLDLILLVLVKYLRILRDSKSLNSFTADGQCLLL